MGQPSLHDIYRHFCLHTVLSGLQSVVGKPKSVITELAQFKTQLVDPTWNMLPLPIRLMGRPQVRWDEFFSQLRPEVFLAPDGRITLRPDASQRLTILANRMFAAGAAPAAPVASAMPMAMPIAPLAPLVAQPVAPKAAAPPAVKPPPPPTPRAKSPAPPAPATSSADIALGIDLGTTYSVVAYLDAHDRPVSIPNATGEIVTPSVVLFDEGGHVVGKEAVQASAMEPEKIAECVKRDMGSKLYRKKVNGELLPPEVVSSIILKALKADAERKLGPIRKAVITVPAYFDESRRRATVDAGRLAGLEVLDIINEPTAAAIAYGYQLGFLDPSGKSTAGQPLNVLVYDLGGGTFDVTIVTIQGTSFKAIATDGDVALGGKDWDEKLIEMAAEQFIHQFREDPRKNPVSHQEMWLAAESCKKTLTERPKAALFVNHVGMRMKIDVTREQFEDATAALLGRTRTTTEIVVRQAGLSWAAIDKVLLVGGSTRMPQVARMLTELTGKPPDRSVSVDEAVAHGAALYAHLLLSKQRPTPAQPRFSITNVNSHSLGIVGTDPSTGRRKNQILIPKNSPLPTRVTKVFKTQKLGQQSVVIRVVEGESERPEACIQVGVCTIGGMPANLPAGSPVTVSYAYHADGRLEVTGEVKGLMQPVTTTFQREHSMDESEMQMWSQYIDAANMQ